MGIDQKLKARPNARPAMEALKERGESIFEGTTGALIPGFADSTVKADDRDETILTPAVPQPGSKSDLKLAPRSAPKMTKKARAVSPFLIFIIGVAIGSLFFNPSIRHSLFKPEISTVATDDERTRWDADVEFHRERTGTKLNRERVQAEFENQQMDASAGLPRRREKDPDMMKGLPLAPEDSTASRSKREGIDLASPDAMTQYTLEEERKSREWERKANKLYLDEFIANAAKAGYAVKVGPDGVARVIGRIPRKPSGFKVEDQLPEESRESDGGAVH